jgi:hypothetical protein
MPLVQPTDLRIKGSTQPELFEGTIQGMVRQLQTDAPHFWQEALTNDGPIEIWEINGDRYLYNGNHRWHAAVEAGVEIPAEHIRIVPKTEASIPLWPLEDRVRLPTLP